MKLQKQKGAALIIFAVIFALAATAFLVSQFDGSGVKNERNKNSALILSKAKTALIGYAIGVIGSGQRPGDLILPDSFAISEGSGDYDGTADSGCLNVSTSNGLPLINSDKNMRCLGRLPWKDLGLSISGTSENDVNGIMPWYAVSGNLIDTTCLKVLNSDTLNLVNNPLAPLDCSGITLPYPWLTVRDSNGNVISDRIAAVIFIPNMARGVQSRPSPALGLVSQYLDTLIVPVGCAVPCIPATYNNADMDNDFILASEGMPSAAANNFNDQLVFITIEELMAAVEKRVAGEVRKQLLAFKVTNGIFPYAASTGYQGQSCVQNSDYGFLPLPMCHCTGSLCDCAYPSTIKFTADQNYSLSSGACLHSANVCSCSGLGSCSRVSLPRRNFSCSSTGVCESNITGTFDFTPSLPLDATSLSATSGCTITGVTATCAGAGTVTVNGSSNQCVLPNLNTNIFPAWFSQNGWKHFIYYAKGGLNIGTNSASALLVTSGQRLTPQTRPSSIITDYLDKPDPPPYGYTEFDALGTTRTSTYNDQMFIVAP
jgi:hypothetical protein